jgi:hypothetical protein
MVKMQIDSVVRSDKKQQDNNNNNDDGGLRPPGVPVIQNDDNGDGSYNDNNIKKFDTSKSIFRSAGSGSSSKIIEYMPGFNDTSYNSTLPYCFAVTSGSCYDTNVYKREILNCVTFLCLSHVTLTEP